MRSTMTLIELLNKIANGEELPNKIKIRTDALVCNNDHIKFSLQDYYYMENEENTAWKIWYYDLNDEVEIIEEDKTIEKLGEIAGIDGDIAYSWSRTETKLKTKINEIIDKINSMED